MDIGDPHSEADFESENEEHSQDSTPKKLRTLPADLPTSLDDRRRAPEYAGETEMYDGWQGRRADLFKGLEC
jgi:hypothetical protein